MATRGRGRLTAANKSRSTQPIHHERQAKSPKTIGELTKHLYSLNEGNLSAYGEAFVNMTLEFAQNEDNMSQAVQLIFDTTVQSRDNVELGAKICQKIVTSLGLDPELKKAQRNEFRRLLLGRFQDEYKNKETTRKLSIESWLSIFAFLYEVFSCVLVNNQPITVVGKAIISTIEWLLSLRDVDDDEVECICECLKKCGKNLEVINSDKIAGIACLLRIKAISHACSCRARCVIMEMLEYRAMGWLDKNKELDRFYMDAIADASVEDSTRAL
jgi:hypothetical protein